MTIISRSLLLLFAGLMVSSFSMKKQQGENWVYERERLGIKVFTKKSKWGKLRDAKAMMQLTVTPEQVLKTLTDFDNYKTWMPECDNSRLLARLSENEYIAYLYFDTPWPVKDRDCVIRVKIEKDEPTGVITLTETSEPKYINKPEDVVRIEQLVSRWTLIPNKDGTLVINEHSSNPGGNIPDWMTNTQSVEHPMETFENLQQKIVKRK